MSLFKMLYQNSILSSHKNNCATVVFPDLYPAISHDAKNNLLFVLNYAYVKAKYPYSLHINTLDSYLLLYTLGGQGEMTYNGHSYALTPNSIFLINCKKGFHFNLHNSSSWNYHRLYLNGNNLAFFYYKYIKSNSPLHICVPSSNLLSTLNKLINYVSTAEYDELVSSLLITTLLTNLVIERNSCNTETAIPKYILQLRELLDTEYFNSYDLDSLSNKFNVNKYTLSKEFSKYIKIPPIEYLIRRRMQVAKELLVDTNYTISEISYQIGIFNTTYFIHLFKKHVGVTPLQYRKQSNKELNLLETF